jgi:hypothetical protein
LAVFGYLEVARMTNDNGQHSGDGLGSVATTLPFRGFGSDWVLKSEKR